MSRVALVVAAVAVLSVTTPPARAQATAATASLPIAEAHDSSKDEPNLAERLLVAPREPRCEDTGAVGGITVCGKKKDNSKDRLPIPDELKSATDIHDGLARAPDVMHNRITGHSIGLGCGLGGCPRALMPDINFRLLPPAPTGSDADLIARGEIRGN